MVTLLREAKGWNQMQLAAAAGMSQAYLSRVERSFVSLEGDKLVDLAQALNCPAELLTSEDIVASPDLLGMYHRRRRSKIPVMAARKIEAIGQLTQITVDGLMGGISRSPMPWKRGFEVECGDPAQAATELRAAWSMAAGPIPDVYWLLDHNDVVVVQRVFDQVDQDAFSVWTRGVVPLIVVRRGLSTDRQRFTVCHELGHLLLHNGPGPEQEQEADRFAAEFLMPSADIAPQLQGLTTGDFDRLLDLKQQWRVSVGALIQRAKTLDLISERQFREFRMKLSRFGWNAVEPIDLAPEHPRLLSDVIAHHRRTRDLSDAEIATIAQMTPEAFERHYLRRIPPPNGTVTQIQQTG
ncbi:helix-turn-helix domain-containing protein [Mycobacteroides salmoniphilum]|uniref:helix-turn-helix domain-containing protein n=1 Tax=Mycobacteroides salmoniphilum TaxID=404941 RepID=UPI001AD7EBD4|nr:XRE family transcriptional regulator [Mycobacteroides salmoniphilum]